MPQADRLAKICRRLQDGVRFDAESLASELEVNRATVFRDLDFLRDRLNAPIDWDEDAKTYRLSKRSGVGDRFIVPGLWLEAKELYGMLTVLNLASAIDPGVASRYLHEFRGALKRALHARDIDGFELHRKITVDLPRPGKEAMAAMEVIGPALMIDCVIVLVADGLPESGTFVVPTALRLKADGWWLEFTRTEDQGTSAVLLSAVRQAKAVNNLADLPDATHPLL
jgi:hypothetical protein